MLGLFKTDKSNVINVNEIDDLIGSIELIDVREPNEFQSGTILTAKNIPMSRIINNPGKYLLQKKKYYLMCQSGSRSSRSCKILSKKGYNVINVTGGISAYKGKKRK